MASDMLNDDDNDEGEVADLVSDEPKSDDADSSYAISLSNKEAERKRLADEVAAFLAKGGSIKVIPENVMADPPAKPKDVSVTSSDDEEEEEFI